MAPSGFQLTSPFERAHEQTILPAELLELSEDDYAARLREYGYSEHAIVQELSKLREYLIKTAKVTEKPSVEPGPVKGQLFNDWARTVRKRRTRKESDDGETNER